jgi:pyruvate/2-oxoacid:ferredoxin oxidoreductase alpha subunit
VLDTIIQSYVMAETINIPVMVVLDAFYQSHTSENVWVPDQNLVDEFLPKKPKHEMQVDFNQYKSIGGMVPPGHYDKLNYYYWKDINKVESLSETIAEEFAKRFGRYYGNIETVNINRNTKMVLVTLSSITTTTRGVLKKYPEIGLLKIRLMKPFPKNTVVNALSRIAEDVPVAVIERNFMGDNDGALMMEMKRALYDCDRKFKLYGFYAGLGGRDVPPVTIEKIIHRLKHNPKEQNWIDFEK